MPIVEYLLSLIWEDNYTSGLSGYKHADFYCPEDTARALGSLYRYNKNKRTPAFFQNQSSDHKRTCFQSH